MAVVTNEGYGVKIIIIITEFMYNEGSFLRI